jgi:hypothetical protein
MQALALSSFVVILFMASSCYGFRVGLIGARSTQLEFRSRTERRGLLNARRLRVMMSMSSDVPALFGLDAPYVQKLVGTLNRGTATRVAFVSKALLSPKAVDWEIMKLITVIILEKIQGSAGSAQRNGAVSLVASGDLSEKQRAVISRTLVLAPLSDEASERAFVDAVQELAEIFTDESTLISIDFALANFLEEAAMEAEQMASYDAEVVIKGDVQGEPQPDPNLYRQLIKTRYTPPDTEKSAASSGAETPVVDTRPSWKPPMDFEISRRESVFRLLCVFEFLRDGI